MLVLLALDVLVRTCARAVCVFACTCVRVRGFVCVRMCVVGVALRTLRVSVTVCVFVCIVMSALFVAVCGCVACRQVHPHAALAQITAGLGAALRP